MLQGSDIFGNLSMKDRQRAYSIIQRSMLDADYPSFYKYVECVMSSFLAFIRPLTNKSLYMYNVHGRSSTHITALAYCTAKPEAYFPHQTIAVLLAVLLACGSSRAMLASARLSCFKSVVFIREDPTYWPNFWEKDPQPRCTVT